MKTNKHKQILGLELVQISGAELFSIKAEGIEYLPEWIINHEGFLTDLSTWINEYYELINPLYTYQMLNKEYADPLLGFEIDNAGLDNVLDKINFTSILPFLIEKPKDGSIGPINRIVIEMEYKCGKDYFNETECDLEIAIVGHIDNNMKFHLLSDK